MTSITSYLRLAALLLTCAASSSAAAQLVAGRDYRVINPPQPTESGKKVEVLEFFWYGCIHCYHLESPLKAWLKRKPADVVFRHVPVVRHDSWVPLAKTYYTLEAMGEVERLHAAVYRSYHVEDLSLIQDKVIAEWAEKHGLSRDRFLAIPGF